VADRPIGFIRPYSEGPRTRVRQGGGPPRRRLQFPTLERQAQRVVPLIQDIANRRLQGLQLGPEGGAPEEVLVFEVADTVDRFLTAVRHTEGLEWLAESDDLRQYEPDADFAVVDIEDDEDRAGYGTRLYLTFANARFLERFEQLWATHVSVERGEQKWPRGLTGWGDTLRLLRDVRRWSNRDRLLDTGILAVWTEHISAGREQLPVEVELWFRGEAADRVRSEQAIRDTFVQAGARVVQSLELEEIRYHGLLADVPVALAQEIVESLDHAFVDQSQIMFFRPTGQFAAVPYDEDLQIPARLAEQLPDAISTPLRVALLDGLPLENHRILGGRLIVDDPDDFAASYTVDTRRHGTAMASIVLRGDLSIGAPDPGEQLYVRPILRPDPLTIDDRETIPDGVLDIDLVHRAVLRMIQGEGDEPPSAPEVRIVNFSVGNPYQVFDTLVSPMARLLDWLAHRYNLLFIVSSGNPGDCPAIEHAGTPIEDLAPAALAGLAIDGIWESARHRRLLAPAESLNALTIGALRSDASGATAPREFAMMDDGTFPSPENGLGLGIQRAVKPDLLAPGGRMPYRLPYVPSTEGRTVLEPIHTVLAPGIRHAYPGEPGRLDREVYTAGSSNAAANVTHLAGRVYRMLERAEPEAVPDSHRTVLTKALIAHSALWPESERVIREALANAGRSRTVRDDVSRFVGFGVVDFARATIATDQRVTLAGWGTLETDEAEFFRIPLPPSLSGIRAWRRLIVTLAWFSPVNSANRKYRNALLWFDAIDEVRDLGVQRDEIGQRLARRGTLQHEVYEGEATSAFVDGSTLNLKVNCRPDAGAIQAPVPYGVALTLEIAPELGLPLYDEVVVRVQAPARVQVAGR
jgi:hypothetical protein